MLDEQRGVVLYTDGSARPTNPGYIGWGAHGYLYEYKTDAKPSLAEGHYITNEGYFTPNEFVTPDTANASLEHRVTAMAAEHNIRLVEPIKYFDFLGSSLQQSSNNRAEVKALVYALEQVEQYGPKRVHVLTDSEYLRNGLTQWCKGWHARGWKTPEGGDIKNREWWERLYLKVLELQEEGMVITTEWVRGHTDIYGNIQADILAGIASNYSMNGILNRSFSTYEAKTFRKQEIDKHPFFNFKRIYFNSVDRFNIPGNYFMADSGAGDLVIGKRIPESGFAVIKLKQHDPIIEAIKQKQFQVSNEINAIIEMKLDRVFSKEVYPYLNEHGGYCLLGCKNNLNLNFMDKSPITVEKNPTGLSMRAIECFNFLEDLLSRFLEYRETGFDQPNNSLQLHSHDLTPTFYDVTEKVVKGQAVVKYNLKPEYGVGFKDMKVSIEETYENKKILVQVPLILGNDILPRNNLKKLETENPKVSLITWRESPNSIRYATIIECDSGIGIWSNHFADKIFLK